MLALVKRRMTGAADGGDSRQIPVHDGLPGRTVGHILDEAPTSRFHRRAVVISGMGFFTDAYDLFVIATVATLVKSQWHLDANQTSWVSGSAILAAFFGALVFGRIADVLGRKAVYTVVAAIMIVGAVASALAPDFIALVVARFVLGLGVGGDYPVSAVLMSEYSNRRDRGRLVGLVFSMQAAGLIIGPLVALILLASGISHELTWRILLGLGAVPATAVVYLRSKMPESPRFQAQVQGRAARAAQDLHAFAGGALDAADAADDTSRHMGLAQFLRNRRMLKLMVATAGTWFLFDYAYYGNTLSLPTILKDVSPHAGVELKLVWSLAIFVVFALPGYLLAVARMDRFGHRRLQLVGFGVSYLFTEFGPNTTTFVLPSEVFPVNMRTTGHGIAAGIGKLGAFIGVFLVPHLQSSIGLRGMLLVAGAAAAVGILLTLLLPEPAGRTLEDVSGQDTGRVILMQASGVDGGEPVAEASARAARPA